MLVCFCAVSRLFWVVARVLCEQAHEVPNGIRIIIKHLLYLTEFTFFA